MEGLTPRLTCLVCRAEHTAGYTIVEKQKMEEIALENCSVQFRNKFLTTIYLFIIYDFSQSSVKYTSWVGVDGEETKSCSFTFSL